MFYLLDITRARMSAFDKKQPESIIEEQLQLLNGIILIIGQLFAFWSTVYL